MAVTRLETPDVKSALTKTRDKTTYLLLSGVNINLIGYRDPKVYGSATLDDVEERITALGRELGVNIVCAQSNIEGEIASYIQYARCLAGVIINPGAFAHYSLALHDSIEACPSPVVEVHISNIYAREEFRHKSVTARQAKGYIAGCGVFGYELALRCCINRVSEENA